MVQRKRQHILETAMQLFNENGFHATPTSKIAKKAKVSVGTLFNYLKTKEDLIESIYIHIKLHSKATFLELLEEKSNIHDTLQSMWHAIVQWGIENPEEFKYLEIYCHAPFRHMYRTEKSLEVYKQFQNEIIRAVIPSTICDNYPEYVLNYIENSIHAATRYLLYNPICDTDQFMNLSFDLCWKGLSFHEKEITT